ncbi:MAG: hypothetical protein EBU49_06715 [Proteobacteria bacterium]|nr:hypothetical protein [Pseudomonadota bacterium]
METGLNISKSPLRLAAALIGLALSVTLMLMPPRAIGQDRPPPEPPAEPPPPPEVPEPEYQPPAPGDFPTSRSAPSKSQPGKGTGEQPAATQGTVDETDDSIIRVPRPQPAKLRSITAAERKNACARFDGKYISYYSEIYHVEKCKRRLVQDPSTLTQIMRGSLKVTEVESDIIAALTAGDSIADQGAKKRRGCKQLEGKFVTFSYVDIYLIQKCKKRALPDWETFIAWQKKMGRKSGIGAEVIPLSEAEFDLLQIGPEIPSAVDLEFIRQYDHSKVVDIIPIDEACRGLEGKTVSFYSKLYKIEKCRKRELDPELATLKNPSLNPKVLTAEQWNSLPDGKPLKNESEGQKSKAVQYKPLPHGG